jgi:hypothetical protein
VALGVPAGPGDQAEDEPVAEVPVSAPAREPRPAAREGRVDIEAAAPRPVSAVVLAVVPEAVLVVAVQAVVRAGPEAARSSATGDAQVVAARRGAGAATSKSSKHRR